MIFSEKDFDYERLVELINTKSPFTIKNGIEAVEIKKGYSHLELDISEKFMNLNDTVHGGLLFTLADMAAGAAAMSFGKQVTTLNGSINFFRPALSGKLIAKCNAVHSGRRTIVCETEIFSNEGKLLCKSTMTMFVLNN